MSGSKSSSFIASYYLQDRSKPRSAHHLNASPFNTLLYTQRLFTDDTLPSGIGAGDMFIIARLNDSSSYFFTWFCKRYRIRIGGRDLSGKLEIQRCPICLDMCTKSIELQCGHAFCRQCLTTSAANNMTSCALCRREQVINPELLRAQFDEQRMLNLAQRLAIPPPLRSRSPKYGVSMSDEVQHNEGGLDVQGATAADAIGHDQDLQESDKVMPLASPDVESMTTHGHLLFGPWGDVGAMTPEDLRSRWKFSNLQTSTLPGTLNADVGAEAIEELRSSWRELQHISHASEAAFSELASANVTPRAACTPPRRSWPGDDLSGAMESRAGEGDADKPSPSTSFDGAMTSVGGATVEALSSRWRTLIRVPLGTSFVGRPPSTLSSVSVASPIPFEPQVAAAPKSAPTVLATDAGLIDAASGDNVADLEAVLTSNDTAGSMSSNDLRNRWYLTVRQFDDVGALKVEELASRLTLSRGQQGVGGKSMANLRQWWSLTCSDYAEYLVEGSTCSPVDSGKHSHIQVDELCARNEGGSVVRTASHPTEVLRAHASGRTFTEPHVLAAPRPSSLGSQDVGALSSSVLYARWRAAIIEPAQCVS